MADYQPHPDVWHGMPVSVDEAHALPRPPGWKYEVMAGSLWLEPDWRYQIARLATPAPLLPTPQVRIVAVDPDAEESLVDAAVRAFQATPEFFLVPAERIQASMARSIHDAITLEPPWVRTATRLARAPDGSCVGALLLREVDGGVLLQSLFVLPAWRRRGIASGLLASARNALPESVEIRSSWMIANRESHTWHVNAGFRVIPTSISMESEWAARHWRLRAASATLITEVDRAFLHQLRNDEIAGLALDPVRFTQPLHRRQRPPS